MKTLLKTAIALLVLVTVTSPLAQAATIYVNSGCRLQDAIESANRDRSYRDCRRGSGSDTIVLTDNVSLRDHMPAIRSVITIDGQGYVINGEQNLRHFKVNSRGRLTLRDVALVNGYEVDGGSVYNDGDLRIDNVLFVGNKASWNGGAIFNIGYMEIDEAIFQSNEADWGGAIMNKGEARIDETSFFFNAVEKGGGAIFNDDRRGTSLWIDDSEFVGNATDDLNHIARNSVKDAGLHALYHAGIHVAVHAMAAGAVKGGALGAVIGPAGVAIGAAAGAVAGIATLGLEAYQVAYGSSGKGGAIVNQGPAQIRDTSFEVNVAWRAGAIHNTSRDLRLRNITRRDNSPNFCVGC